MESKLQASTPMVRTLVGRVVSDKMQKTIVILVERTVKHPKYGKILRRSSKVQAHDAQQVCKIGDLVRVRESRPISKNKSWTLESVLSSSE